MLKNLNRTLSHHFFKERRSLFYSHEIFTFVFFLGSTFSFDVTEPDTLVVDLKTLDGVSDDSSFSITGGDDQDLFDITEDGILEFRSDPDFESPVDANGDNIYEVEITETDPVSGDSDVINIDATVTDGKSLIFVLLL